MSWTPEKIKQLKKLWAKGKSTVEIGRELGISKNAVVGKVHRLELDARPSPIKKVAAPSLKVQKAKHNNNKGYMTLLDLKLNSCRWPIGEPKDADFHFCGKDTVTGKPYCSEHCKVAYTSLKELTSQNKNDPKKEASEEIIEDVEFEEIKTDMKPKTSKSNTTLKEEAKLSNSVKASDKSKTLKVEKVKGVSKPITKTSKNPASKENTHILDLNEKNKEKNTIQSPSKKNVTKKQTSDNTNKGTKTVKKQPTPKGKSKGTAAHSTPVASILKRVVTAAKTKRK